MWNNQWPDDPSWFHANPFGQYPPSAPPQHSVPSQHSIPSQVSVPPQVYQSALGACSQSIPNGAAAAESRSLTPSPVSFSGQGSVGSSQSIPNRTAAAESRSLTPSPVSFSCQGSVGTDSDDGATNQIALNCGNVNRRKQWSREEVLALLDVYEKRRGDFKDPKKRNKDVWETIGAEMEELGFADKRNDCEIKFKNMKRTYISTVDHNNTSGNDRKTCAYFDEMNKLFQKDVRIQPVAVCSSRAGTKKTAESTSEKDATCSESENDTLPSKRKRKKTKASDDLVSLFKDFTKTREERERERMQELKDMHTEKMTMMGRFLQVFEKSFEKD